MRPGGGGRNLEAFSFGYGEIQQELEAIGNFSKNLQLKILLIQRQILFPFFRIGVGWVGRNETIFL